jgi:hypothetical protein
MNFDVSQILIVYVGYPGCHHLQVVGRLRIDHFALPSDYEENMDEPTFVGRLHSVRKDYRPRELRGTAATA